MQTPLNPPSRRGCRHLFQRHDAVWIDIGVLCIETDLTEAPQ